MESLRRLSSPANPQNFITIVFPNNIKSARIKIPEKFIEKHGGSLLDRVILKVPNGDVWQVDLIKSKGAIWLKNGWRQFAEHYNLKYGHLLLFKYEGFSIFGVFIFDSSACEIVYPKTRHHLGHNSTEIKSTRSSDSCKKVDIDELKTVKSEQETCSSWSQDQETEIKINGECSSKRVEKQGRCYQEEKNRALEAAKASFKSEKPFFMIYMSPSCVAGRTCVHIPMKFIEKHWRGYKKHNTCVLRLAMDETCRTWEAAAHSTTLGVGGWKIFVKDNGVSAGDVCVFELLKKHGNVLNVSIFRAAS